jgi:hypothetical protein
LVAQTLFEHKPGAVDVATIRTSHEQLAHASFLVLQDLVALTTANCSEKVHEKRLRSLLPDEIDEFFDGVVRHKLFQKVCVVVQETTDTTSRFLERTRVLDQ